MIFAPLVVVLVASQGSLESDFPEAKITRTPAGVTQALGLSVPADAGEPRASAAEKLLRRYAEDFRVAGQDLVADGGGNRVRLSRRVQGLPIINGDIVVVFDDAGRIVLVNTGMIPGPLRGKFALGSKAAISRARESVRGGAGAKVSSAKVWYPVGRYTQAAWSVDLATAKPVGNWRVFVDAQSGRILFKEDLRVTGR